MDWALLAEGAVAINRGVLWVATNVDPTVPSPRGPLPGNGSLVAALRHATRRDPVVTGKPDPTMHRETVLRTGAKIRSSSATGSTPTSRAPTRSAAPACSCSPASPRWRDLSRAAQRSRPTYLGQDLGAVVTSHPRVDVEASSATCGQWRAAADRGGNVVRVVVTAGAEPAADRRGTPEPEKAGAALGLAHASSLDGTGSHADQLDAIRALCAAIWSTSVEGVDAVAVEAADGDEPARARWTASGSAPGRTAATRPRSGREHAATITARQLGRDYAAGRRSACADVPAVRRSSAASSCPGRRRRTLTRPEAQADARFSEPSTRAIRSSLVRSRRICAVGRRGRRDVEQQAVVQPSAEHDAEVA